MAGRAFGFSGLGRSQVTNKQKARRAEVALCGAWNRLGIVKIDLGLLADLLRLPTDVVIEGIRFNDWERNEREIAYLKLRGVGLPVIAEGELLSYVTMTYDETGNFMRFE
jgi:hypothetical protein